MALQSVDALLDRRERPLVLSETAVAVPALASVVRPSLVLPEREALTLLRAAATHDVERGGCFAAGPACVQVWSGPFDGPGHTRGTAVHLGSVDWCYDTPSKHWVTIYRAIVTAEGVERGQAPLTILDQVLGLTGLAIDSERVSLPAPPARDPFHSDPEQAYAYGLHTPHGS